MKQICLNLATYHHLALVTSDYLVYLILWRAFNAKFTPYHRKNIMGN